MAIYLGNTLLTGPSGGTGDAVLADDQTFTGQNTFSDTAIFGDTSTDGSIQVASRISHQGDTDTYIEYAAFQEMYIVAPGALSATTPAFLVSHSAVAPFNTSMYLDSTVARFNVNRRDNDFEVRKETSGVALDYDAGTDTLLTEAANLAGFAGSETGTWTPSFSGGGTQGTTTATYSKTGSTVIAHASVFIAPGTIPQPFALTPSSLPFSNNSPSNAAIGTYFVAATNNSLSQSNSGVVASGTATSIVFLDNVREDELAGTEIRGYIGFTLTYQTND